MNTTRVLALLPLFVMLAHSFSWDIVLGAGKRFKFYNNGKLTHTEDNPSSKDIYAVSYDSVHFKVLFVEYHNNMSISSFDIATRKIQILVTKPINTLKMHLAYDPVTQLLFWTEGMEIYSISLKPASSNKTVDGNLSFTANKYCRAIAVDSCGGYIYWATNTRIERAAFDGSENEVLINLNVYSMRSLAIDQQTKKMYWTQEITANQHSIESADLNGINRRTIYSIGKEYGATSLVVSKDFIYWRSSSQRVILQLPKHEQDGVAPIVYSDSTSLLWQYHLLAANYTIEEQTLGAKSCEALKSLLRNSSDVCLNGSTCYNYCLQGNCSISAEGRPKCSCEAGYSGERCEVNACYMYCLHGGVCSLNEEDEPVCQCTADYEGDRCDVATSLSGVCVCADKTKQQILEEVKQVRENLQCTLQLYSDKLDENAAKIQICEESMKDNSQNHDETTSKMQTLSNIKV